MLSALCCFVAAELTDVECRVLNRLHELLKVAAGFGMLKTVHHMNTFDEPAAKREAGAHSFVIKSSGLQRALR